MVIAQHTIRQTHLRHGTTDERAWYRKAVNIERGRRRAIKNRAAQKTAA